MNADSPLAKKRAAVATSSGVKLAPARSVWCVFSAISSILHILKLGWSALHNCNEQFVSRSPYETCCHLHLAPTDTWIFWSFEKEKRQGGAICDQSRHKERSPRYLESTELLLTRRFFTSFDYLMNFLQSLDCLHWLITLQFCLLITTSFGFVVVV